MCAMILILYGWYLRNRPKIDQGTATCDLFAHDEVNASILSKTVDTFRTKLSRAVLHYMADLCVQ